MCKLTCSVGVHTGAVFAASPLKLCALALTHAHAHTHTCVHLLEQPGEASYAKWKEEKDSLYSALSRKSKMVTTKLNAIDGVSCQTVEGAMYAFPKIEMPPGAIAAAEAAGHPPDTFYALSLLEQTGLCTVPGNGFGQKDGGCLWPRASGGMQGGGGRVEWLHESDM